MQYYGRKFGLLTVIDEANREALLAECVNLFSGKCMVRVLDALIDFYGFSDYLYKQLHGSELNSFVSCDKRHESGFALYLT